MNATYDALVQQWANAVQLMRRSELCTAHPWARACGPRRTREQERKVAWPALSLLRGA